MSEREGDVDPGRGARPAAPEEAAVREGLVAANTLCRRCGYSLFRLPVTGACPECAKPVRESLRGDLLEFCDDAYLRSLERGSTLILWSFGFLVLSVLLMFGAEAVAAVVEEGGDTAARKSLAHTIRVLAELVSTLAHAVLTVWGWWLFSTPDPGVHVSDPGHRPRRALRVAVSLMAVVGLSESALAVSEASLRPAFSLSVASALALAWIVLLLAQFLAAMNYIGWLAPRIPSAEIGARARTFRWLLPLITVVGCAIGAVVALVLHFRLVLEIRRRVRAIRLLGSVGASAPVPTAGSGTLSA